MKNFVFYNMKKLVNMIKEIPNGITVVPQKVESYKITRDFIFVQLSDIGFDDKLPQKRLDNLVKKVQEINPDYVVIPGDLFFDKANNERLYKFIRDLTLSGNDDSLIPKRKIFITLGNHCQMAYSEGIGKERKWIPCDRKEEYSIIRSIPGVIVLENETYDIDELNVRITGHHTDFEHYEIAKETKEDYINKTKKSFSQPLDNAKFNHVSTHSPYIIFRPDVKDEVVLTKGDIISCGHMHNAMIPTIFANILPGTMGLVGPHGDLFPKYARKKVYLGEGRWGFITGAVTSLSETYHNSKLSKLINFFCSPSIYSVNVKKTSEDKVKTYKRKFK